MTKFCSNCAFSCTQDYGYSEYTIEGTDTHCMLNLNPNSPFEAVQLDIREEFASECPSYKEGETADFSWGNASCADDPTVQKAFEDYWEQPCDVVEWRRRQK